MAAVCTRLITCTNGNVSDKCGHLIPSIHGQWWQASLGGKLYIWWWPNFVSLDNLQERKRPKEERGTPTGARLKTETGGRGNRTGRAIYERKGCFKAGWTKRSRNKLVRCQRDREGRGDCESWDTTSYAQVPYHVLFYWNLSLIILSSHGRALSIKLGCVCAVKIYRFVCACIK